MLKRPFDPDDAIFELFSNIVLSDNFPGIINGSRAGQIDMRTDANSAFAKFSYFNFLASRMTIG